MEGDDADEFLEAYADRFAVDLSSLIWYIHYNADEPPGIRRVLPIANDGKVIPYIPITLQHLVDAADRGRWEFDYPDHSVRHRRGQMFVALLVLIGLAAIFGFAFTLFELR